GANRAGALWLALAAAWLALVLVSLRGAIRADFARRQKDAFPAGMSEYLRGNWLEAEMVVRRLVADRPGDVEAGLLLASGLRRSRRLDEARSALDELSRWDVASAWRMEIDGEYRHLAELEAERAERDMHAFDTGSETLPNLDRAA